MKAEPESVVIRLYTLDEKWVRDNDVFCPRCGIKGQSFSPVSNVLLEDNAGDYFICVNCNHDWYMYGLEGYHPRRAKRRAKLIAEALE